MLLRGRVVADEPGLLGVETELVVDGQSLSGETYGTVRPYKAGRNPTVLLYPGGAILDAEVWPPPSASIDIEMHGQLSDGRAWNTVCHVVDVDWPDDEWSAPPQSRWFARQGLGSFPIMTVHEGRLYGAVVYDGLGVGYRQGAFVGSMGVGWRSTYLRMPDKPSATLVTVPMSVGFEVPSDSPRSRFGAQLRYSPGFGRDIGTLTEPAERGPDERVVTHLLSTSLTWSTVIRPRSRVAPVGNRASFGIGPTYDPANTTSPWGIGLHGSVEWEIRRRR